MTEILAFRNLNLPARSSKPRNLGITMMIDWGIPVNHQVDVLEISSNYIDMAKIAGTIAGFLSEDILRKKLAHYQDFGVSTSQGGLFFEYAYLNNKIEPFFENISRLGFSAIEISDNLLSWDLEEKYDAIQLAIKTYGLKVLGEVGRKDAVLDDDFVIRDIELCLEAGATAIFLEAFELFPDGKVRSELINQIVQRFPQEKIIFELPVVVLPGITRDIKHKISSWMVTEFGPDVNLANVEWDEILMTEMLRTKTGDNLKT